jgi:hypothetical protein
MDVCSNCRRPRKEGSWFCTGCGHRFPDDRIDPAETEDAHAPGWDNTRPIGGDRTYEPPNLAPSSQSPRPKSAWLIFAVAAVAVTAGGLTGFALLSGGHHAPRTETVRTSGESGPIGTPAGQGDATSGQSDAGQTSSPSSIPSSPAPAASVVGQVTIAANASQDPDASAVAAFLNQYFTAINDHDYQSYISLLSPQVQSPTEQQFDNGYSSTVDSAETLLGISTAADGDLVVSVEFTSHQNPAQSPNQAESCTEWDISLFLEQGGGGGYLVDEPPSGYHASYNACS